MKALKLALLYIVYGFFFIHDRTTNDINLKYLNLVDYIERFINYLWERRRTSTFSTCMLLQRKLLWKT